MHQVFAQLWRPAARSLARIPGACVPAARVTACAARRPLLASIRHLSWEASARAAPSEAPEHDHATGETSGASVPARYSEYTGINPGTLKAIKQVLRFETATPVQHQLLSRMPIEGDIMVKAKTGTGKTAAFLVPAIEAILREYEADPSRTQKRHKIGCVIVSPSRELAQQIASEAAKLTRFHRLGVVTLVGGESSRGQLRDLASRNADIVVGTPGRLNDFFTNQPSFQEQVAGTKLLILDEADMLLDMGFRNELNNIVAQLPADRQTFLVSATMGRNVKDLAATVFTRGFDMIDCVGKDEANTHANVKQEYIHTAPSQMLPVTIDLIQSHIEKNTAERRGSKIVIFLPTVKAADLYADVLKQVVSRRGRESVNVTLLHGKVRQERRVRLSDMFRNSPVTVGTTSILVTTDVSARGVDYPDVSMVIQGGIPSQTESYVHRLGRTGRAGKSGEGVALLTDIDLPFLNLIRDIPIVRSEKYTPEYIAEVCAFKSDTTSALASRWENIAQNTDPDMIRDAYVSLLAFYGAHVEMIGKPHGQEIINGMAGLLEPFGAPVPALPKTLEQALRLGKGLGPRDRRGSQFGSRGGFNSDRQFGSRGGFNSDRSSGSRGGFSSDRQSGSRGGFSSDRSSGSRGGFSSDRSSGSRGGFSNDRSSGSRGGFSNDRSSGSRQGGFVRGSRNGSSRPSFGQSDRPRFSNNAREERSVD
ncbi:hypothetical protein H4R19_004426 [Coemansia spiralis]|nr:hypothetical protein H4R19_004426 [Coemansia spiralis]